MNRTYLFIFVSMIEQFDIFSLNWFKSVLTLNQDIWSFHGSFNFDLANLTSCFRSPWYDMLINMTDFLIFLV